MSVYPRVLIVSGSPLTLRNGTGITLVNLFKDWDPDALAQAYFVSMGDEADFCKNNMRVTELSFPHDFLVRKLLWYWKPAHASKSAGVPTIINKSEGFALKKRIHLIARAVNDMGPVIISSTLRTAIRKFNPNVIYTQLGSIRMMNLAIKTAHIAQCPIVPHFMDDWLSTLYSEQILNSFPLFIMKRKLKQILAQTPLGLCIGEDMAEEYRRRYDIEFYPFMNVVDEDYFHAPSSHSQSSDSPCFTYIGGLHLERWRLIKELAIEISGFGCQMNIFAPERDISEYRQEFESIPQIKLGSLPANEVFAEMRQADVLVHVESFQPNVAAYTRLSVSTKIPQYMASSRPILAYGPENLASMRLIRRSGAGHVISVKDREGLNQGIQYYIQNKCVRLQHAQNGYNYALKYFSAPQVRALFRSLLVKSLQS